MNLEYFTERQVILLYSGLPEEVTLLRTRIGALANATLQQIPIHELPGFRSINNCRLTASVCQQARGIFQFKETNSFECQLPLIDWQRIEGLLEPFAEGSGVAGHQYLDQHGEIELIISSGRGW